jgi:DNA modification methylase
MSASEQDRLGPRLFDRSKMTIVFKTLEELLPYAKNARTHSPQQVAQIAGSMREWGWTNPVLIDEHHMIIAGHGRVLAARKLNLVDDIPCIVLAGLTKTQKQALIIADNKLAMNAAWDDDLLLQELGELNEDGFDLNTIGFSPAEMDALLHGIGPTLDGEDEGPGPVPVTPISVDGDLWILGNHRIICGDSSNATAVERLLNGVKPHLMVTDPPYGVNYDPNWRSGLDKVKRSTGKVSNDDRADWREVYALFPGDVAYVWHDWKSCDVVMSGLRDCGFSERAQIIWVKPHFVLSRGHYHPQHEPCIYAVKKTATGHWGGDRKQSTVWQINNGTFQGGAAKAEDEKTGHGTQKPVECMRRPIENNSSPGQAIYEPFSGSGTTIIAAEMTGRICFAVEISPAYVDVAVQRWQKFSGQTAKLDGDGRSFDEIGESRER